jgi:hypothetical protein
MGTAAPCPYVRSSPLRLGVLCVFALPSFALNGVPWADGWCCGCLGTAGPCPYGWGPLRLCALCVFALPSFALNGVPCADGVGGRHCRAPTGGVKGIWARHAVRLRVALWVFGHGSAVGRRVVLWVFGHGMPCPYGWGDGVPWADGWCCGGLGTAAPCPYGVGGWHCRAPAGGVVGVWARHAVPLRVGDGVPWANGWCCGCLGTACRAPTGGVSICARFARATPAGR